jgi:leader peptidase (prepilin peptidase)/N-methyltransferase
MFYYEKVGILIAALIYLSYLDIKMRAVPIRFTYLLLVAGLVLTSMDSSFTDAVVGASIGVSVPLFIRESFIVFFQKEGMGDGDASVLACIGAFLGWKAALFSLTNAAVLGLLFALLWRRKELPFVPFLLMGVIVYLFLPKSIINLFFTF